MLTFVIGLTLAALLLILIFTPPRMSDELREPPGPRSRVFLEGELYEYED